jgi:hypothetical protein
MLGDSLPNQYGLGFSVHTGGLSTFSCSEQPGRENQVLIASRYAQRRHELVVPDIRPSVRSNVLAVSLVNPDVTVLGFRMPDFEGKDRALKRLTWNWLLGEAERLRSGSALIVGDFNTDPGVPRRAEYSWGFERLASGGTSGKVGCPDHAMLICEFNPAPASMTDSQGPKASELAARSDDQV